jgi:predicted DCC family thiol-disulfide oxidoreductase YuxK
MLKRTIFFDGRCQLCSREIDIFQRLVKDDRFAYVDISLPSFDPVPYGIDAVRVNKHMHVRNEETQQMLIGVDALISMWELVPGFRWLAWLTRLPLIKPFARVGYAVFAWIRPYLPKRRQAACDTGACTR